MYMPILIPFFSYFLFINFICDFIYCYDEQTCRIIFYDIIDENKVRITI